jgi:hypothetical protein
LKCEFYGYPAPLKALQIIEESMNLPLSDAYPLEHAATLELAQDRRSIVQGSVGLFLLVKLLRFKRGRREKWRELMRQSSAKTRLAAIKGIGYRLAIAPLRLITRWTKSP